jgi:hypothetical protein
VINDSTIIIDHKGISIRAQFILGHQLLYLLNRNIDSCYTEKISCPGLQTQNVNHEHKFCTPGSIPGKVKVFFSSVLRIQGSLNLVRTICTYCINQCKKKNYRNSKGLHYIELGVISDEIPVYGV